MASGGGSRARGRRQSTATPNAVNHFREVFERQFEQVYTRKWQGVARIRAAANLDAATRKYPDFIEIGLDVWDNVYDWHVVPISSR